MRESTICVRDSTISAMEWVRRNRRRLAVGGGVLGGLYIVGR